MIPIEITDFKKYYGPVEAVQGVSLKIEAGELFGLIGPDGAGKTTLMRSICTLLKPTAGKILVTGHDTTSDIRNIRKILGYMPQRFSLYQDLTVEQNLQFFADLYLVPDQEREERLQKLYRFSRLDPFKKRLAGELSGGMKQKLALSCALIHTPEILILDEPTFGVDPLSREEFWNILKSLREEGTTIFISTAYMEEAELCDRVAFMYRGKVLITGKPQHVKNSYPYPLYKIEGKDIHNLRSFFQQQPDIHSTQLFGNSIHISFESEPAENEWQSWQDQSGGNLQSWDPLLPSIEDVFMHLTGEESEAWQNSPSKQKN